MKYNPYIASLLVALGCLLLSNPAFAQVGTTVLPTDMVPIPGRNQGETTSDFTRAMQLKVLQKLPSSFYFTSSTESTFRIETNPFQFPNQTAILNQNVPRGQTFADLDTMDQLSTLHELSEVNAFDNINRINPNVTAGWAPSANTQIYANYFMIRDSLLHNSVLSSNTNSIGPGIQHNFNIGKTTTLQLQYQMRELWQTGQPGVFDLLPAVTLQRQITPNLVVFLNTVLQIRFKGMLGGPMRELDPFYTVGGFYQRGAWSFSSTCTFLQNWRQPFAGNSLIPVNNLSFVLDFEVDRQISKKVPGLVTLVRAEPVFNFASESTPGISGFDFRFYYGFRLSMTKPPLTGTIQQLRQRYMREQLQQQESELPNPTVSSIIGQQPHPALAN